MQGAGRTARCETQVAQMIRDIQSAPHVAAWAAGEAGGSRAFEADCRPLWANPMSMRDEATGEGSGGLLPAASQRALWRAGLCIVGIASLFPKSLWNWLNLVLQSSLVPHALLIPMASVYLIWRRHRKMPRPEVSPNPVFGHAARPRSGATRRWILVGTAPARIAVGQRLFKPHAGGISGQCLPKGSFFGVADDPDEPASPPLLRIYDSLADGGSGWRGNRAPTGFDRGRTCLSDTERLAWVS